MATDADIAAAYYNARAALNRVTAVLPAGLASRYEAPSGFSPTVRSGYPTDPTFDIVADTRRAAVSQAVNDVHSVIEKFTLHLEAHLSNLAHAIDRHAGLDKP